MVEHGRKEGLENCWVGKEGRHHEGLGAFERFG